VAGHLRDGGGGGAGVRRGCSPHERPQRQDQLPRPEDRHRGARAGATRAGRPRRRWRLVVGRCIRRRRQQQQPVADPQRQAPQVLQDAVPVAHLPPPRPGEVPHWRVAEARRRPRRLQLGHDRPAQQGRGGVVVVRRGAGAQRRRGDHADLHVHDDHGRLAVGVGDDGGRRGGEDRAADDRGAAGQEQPGLALTWDAAGRRRQPRHLKIAWLNEQASMIRSLSQIRASLW
jgi:hypothetical protein